MGLKEIASLVVLVAVAVYYLARTPEPNLPLVIGGWTHDDCDGVIRVFRENVKSGKEKGAAFSVYHKGVLLIDLWAGYADLEAQRPWRSDTVTLAFSATKGVAAVIVAKMVESGSLDYDKPVSFYWPEFAKNGKENITVGMLLSHQAGLVYLDTPISLKDIKTNPKKVDSILTAQRPVWPPGTKVGYHVVTFGLYVDRLIQKADKKGRDTATIFHEDIAKPFGIDFSMNLSPAQFYRTARIYPRSPLQLLIDCLYFPQYLNMLWRIMFKPNSLLAKSLLAIPEYNLDTAILNDPENRDVTVSTGSGTGTARGLAKLFGILANGGKYGDQQLLSQKLLNALSTPMAEGYDEVMEGETEIKFGPGMIIAKNPTGEFMLRHTGHGGQVAYADVTNDVGLAYLTNHLSLHGKADDPRFLDLQEATYKCIETYKRKLNKDND